MLPKFQLNWMQIVNFQMTSAHNVWAQARQCCFKIDFTHRLAWYHAFRAFEECNNCQLSPLDGTVPCKKTRFFGRL